MRLVSIYRYCAGCLGHDHTWRTCESTGKCKRCGDMHHTLLHKQQARPRSSGHTKRLQRHGTDGPSSSRMPSRGPRSSDGHESEGPSTSQALVPSTSRNRNSRRSKKSKRPSTSQAQAPSSSRSHNSRRSRKGTRPSSSQALVASTTHRNNCRAKNKKCKNTRQNDDTTVSLQSFHVREVVFLKATAIVRLEVNERFVDVRVVIDATSECSIVSDEVVRRISGREVMIGNKKRCLLRISGRHGNSTVVETYAEVRHKYSVLAPGKSVDSRIVDEFPGLQLADPQFNVAAPVNVLLGGDVYGRIVRNGVHGGSFGKPLAQFTIFGYIISGPCSPY